MRLNKLLKKNIICTIKLFVLLSMLAACSKESDAPIEYQNAKKKSEWCVETVYPPNLEEFQGKDCISENVIGYGVDDEKSVIYYTIGSVIKKKYISKVNEEKNNAQDSWIQKNIYCYIKKKDREWIRDNKRTIYDVDKNIELIKLIRDEKNNIYICCASHLKNTYKMALYFFDESMKKIEKTSINVDAGSEDLYLSQVALSNSSKIDMLFLDGSIKRYDYYTGEKVLETNIILSSINRLDTTGLLSYDSEEKDIHIYDAIEYTEKYMIKFDDDMVVNKLVFCADDENVYLLNGNELFCSDDWEQFNSQKKFSELSMIAENKEDYVYNEMQKIYEDLYMWVTSVENGNELKETIFHFYKRE